MKLKINLGGKKLIIDNVIETTFWLKFKGLMFRSKEKAPILLFNISRKEAIHSYFVFFKFLILWLDKDNNVVDWKVVKPFSLYEKSSHHFSKIIEIPISRRYFNIVKFIVGERFKKK